ncbi:MAG: hypothetical protein IPM48_09885 [Saprospiraceae bacterium]|nr:hypothetical protein [Saprospiraceae bacterium]
MKTYLLLTFLLLPIITKAQVSCVKTRVCLILNSYEIINGQQQKRDRTGYVTMGDDALILNMEDSQGNKYNSRINFTSPCILSKEGEAFSLYGVNKKGEKFLLTMSIKDRSIVIILQNKDTGKEYLYDLVD